MTLMISTSLWLLAAVVSILVAQLVPRVSGNYVSLVVGALMFLVPVIRQHVVAFDSEVFMGLIVAPLLFFEGQSTRMNLVGRKLRYIVQLTVSLVLIGLAIVGVSVWWLGGISLPLAFMLAAIGAPTDATATQSVSNGLKMPASTGTLLKLESLFNDASGIILLNMAVLWYINGYVNVKETAVDFLISAGGGAALGLGLAWVIVLWRQQLLRTAYNVLNAQVLLYIVTPFILYYVAEAVHVSGIIAVVCAGLVHNAEAQRSRLINSPQIHFSLDLVTMITEIFNSTVFVVLGFLFVQIVTNQRLVAHAGNWVLIGVTLYIASVIVRYGYGRLSIHLNRRLATIFSLGGVHGAVTLALAYTIAERHIQRGDFDLILLSASVLILLSMIVPTIAFQFLLAPEPSNRDLVREVDDIKVKMVHQAIDAVQSMYLPERVKRSVVFDLMTQKQKTRTRDFVRAWVDVSRHPEFTDAEKELEMRAFINAFKQEREYLDMISQSEAKYQQCVYQLYNEVLLAESLVVGPNVFEE